MALTADEIEGLGIALNEATLMNVLLNRENFVSVMQLSVLTLADEDNAESPEQYIQLAFRPTGRIAVSLLHGWWDDRDAPIEPFEVDRLSEIVARVAGPIYGWEFIDVPAEQGFARWSDRLSLDWRSGSHAGFAHTFTLSRDWGDGEWFDLQIWFDELGVFDCNGEQMPLEAFITGGKRWWDAFFADDPRTHGRGLAAYSSPESLKLLRRFFRRGDREPD